MSNPWFRMYAEFAHDPKVQMLSEAMQRRYMMIMCMRCSNNLVTLHETEIAFHLRISNEELAETKALFVAKGFIDAAWDLLNWEKRQFVSDNSNARVSKHRALQKEKRTLDGNADVTLPKRKSNALDTDTDTDSYSDKKTKTETKAHDFEKFWNAYPKKDGKKDAIAAWAKVKAPIEILLLAIEKRRNTDDWTKSKGQFVPLPATWLNGKRWDDELASFGSSAPANVHKFAAAARTIFGDSADDRRTINA